MPVLLEPYWVLWYPPADKRKKRELQKRNKQNKQHSTILYRLPMSLLFAIVAETSDLCSPVSWSFTTRLLWCIKVVFYWMPWGFWQPLSSSLLLPLWVVASVLFICPGLVSSVNLLRTLSFSQSRSSIKISNNSNPGESPLATGYWLCFEPGTTLGAFYNQVFTSFVVHPLGQYFLILNVSISTTKEI